MKLLKTMLITMLAFLLCSCQNSESNTLSSALNTYFAYEDHSFLPGDMKWNDTWDVILKQMDFSKAMIKKEEENRILVENPIPGLKDDCKSMANFLLQDQKLMGIHLIFTVESEETASDMLAEVLPWAKETVPEPQVDTELWEQEDTEIIDKALHTDSGIDFVWNADDGSYFNINVLKQESVIIQVRSLAAISK